ncbi:MAG: type IV pilus secretin PilQ [Pseudomonadota bacterium]
MNFVKILSMKKSRFGLSILFGGVLGALSTLALAAQNGLLGVSVSQGKNNSQVVKVQFKEVLGAEPVAFTTSNPYRLVLDFPDMANSMGRRTENVGGGALKSYQAVESAGRTRLVFTLAGPAQYELRQDKNVLYAVLAGGGEGAKEASVPAFPAAATAGSGVSVRDVEFQRGKNGEGRVVVSLSNPGTGIDIQHKGKSIQVDFLNTSLPTALQRRLDVADFATPAQLIETFARDKSTRMVVTPRGKWDYYAYQTGDQFILEVRNLEDPTLQSDKPQYSGEKLSLNFQNVDVRSVLQVIADFTGLNIIASDTVNGSVSLRLKDVPWDQALDIIMRSKGLDKRVSGNVIWVAPRDELTAREKAELEAKKAVEDLEPLVTRSYKLNYVRADDAMVMLAGGSRRSNNTSDSDATCSPSSQGIQAIDTSGSSDGASTTTNTDQTRTSTNINRVLSTRGGASHDLTTNTLIVTDVLDKHAAVEEVLKQIDVPMRQVMIEARIVVADDTFGRDLGVRLGLHSAGNVNGGTVGLSSSGSASRGLATGTAVSSQTGFNVQLPDAAGVAGASSLGLTILNAAANTMLSLELQALEADNRGKIVSNPRVVTTNLKPAVILQGTQIPYQTVSTNGTQTQFKDALLCLLVAPQVLNNDAVILNVEVQKDAQGVTTTAGPAINVKRVKTQVRVNNGETAILGGIFEQTVRDDTTKVPLLGDIPVLGHLFKSNSKTNDKSELLIFLTPRLIDDGLAVTR